MTSRAVKLLKRGMKVVERVPEKRLHRIVTVDKMKFGFMSERGTFDTLFILRILQEEYHVRGKMLYMCFMGLRNAFNRVPRIVGNEE